MLRQVRQKFHRVRNRIAKTVIQTWYGRPHSRGHQNGDSSTEVRTWQTFYRATKDDRVIKAYVETCPCCFTDPDDLGASFVKGQTRQDELA